MLLFHARGMGWGFLDFCDKVGQGVGGLSLQCDVTFFKQLNI